MAGPCMNDLILYVPNISFFPPPCPRRAASNSLSLSLSLSLSTPAIVTSPHRALVPADRFTQLALYKAQKGTCDVPVKEEPQLGRW